MNNDIKNEILMKMGGLSKDDQIKILNSLIKDISAECDEQTHYDPHHDLFNATLRNVLHTHYTRTMNEMTHQIQNNCGDIISMIYHIFDLIADNGIHFKNTAKIHITENYYTNCIIFGHFVDEDDTIVLNIEFNVEMNHGYDYTGKFQLGIKEHNDTINEKEYFICREAIVYMYGGRFAHDNIVHRFVSDRMLQKDENGIHSKIKSICDVADKFCKYLDKTE